MKERKRRWENEKDHIKNKSKCETVLIAQQHIQHEQYSIQHKHKHDDKLLIVKWHFRSINIINPEFKS